jgi:membrane associated rhomboid family serine protease
VAQVAGRMTCYRHPDRETGLTCSECGRPICTDCMTMAPVGIRCPDHSGRPQGVEKVTRSARRFAYEGTGALLTRGLIGANVAVFLAVLATGGTLGGIGGPIYERGVLVIRAVAGGELVGLAEGEWWRLITAGFLHAGLVHLGFNMFLLWIFGAPLEQMLGRGRFALLYFTSMLAGSAGALVLSPGAATVGASGAVFGLFGAMFVLERQHGVTRGPATTIIVLNLAITFLIPGISIGGHLGGLAGGALSMLALSRGGRAHAAYGKPGALGTAGVVAVAAVSVLVAVLQVARFA